MKKQFIILSIVLFFLMMACVSANDANQTADNLASVDSTANTESHIKINSHNVNDDEKIINETTKNSIEKTHEEIQNESKIEDTNNDGENNLLRQNADDSHKNENSKSNDEILAAYNQDILTSFGKVNSIIITQYSITDVKYLLSFGFDSGQDTAIIDYIIISYDVNDKASIIGEGQYSITRNSGTTFNEYSLSLSYSFDPSIKYILRVNSNGVDDNGGFFGKGYSVPFVKTSVTGISVTGGNDYNYGASGNPIVYTGKVNGKQGTASLAGPVYIYRDGSHVATVNCNANGDFSYAVSSTSLNVGKYTYTCYYGGNTYYNAYGSASSRQASKTITVSKGTPQITIAPSISEDTYPGIVNVKFTVKNLNGNALKDIILTPNGNKFNSSAVATDSNGQASFTVTPLDAGTYSDWTVSTTETGHKK